jgi:hypothetical protein
MNDETQNNQKEKNRSRIPNYAEITVESYKVF